MSPTIAHLYQRIKTLEEQSSKREHLLHLKARQLATATKELAEAKEAVPSAFAPVALMLPHDPTGLKIKRLMRGFIEAIEDEGVNRFAATEPGLPTQSPLDPPNYANYIRKVAAAVLTRVRTRDFPPAGVPGQEVYFEPKEERKEKEREEGEEWNKSLLYGNAGIDLAEEGTKSKSAKMIIINTPQGIMDTMYDRTYKNFARIYYTDSPTGIPTESKIKMDQKEKLKIALMEYCRDQQAIRDAEFTLVKSRDQHQASSDELIRVMKAIGCKNAVFRNNVYCINSLNKIFVKPFDNCSIVIED